MPLQKFSYQLPLELDVAEIEVSASREVINIDEMRLRELAARKALEGMVGKIGSPRWLDDYLELCKGGWPWRVAAYIAWASTPKGSREPKTQDQLATNHLGLTSDRAINTWRKKNPAIDEMVRMMQSGPLFKHRSEIYTALVAVAVKPEYKSHNDRKLALELMGDYMPTHKLLTALTARGNAGVKTDAELDDLVKALESETPIALAGTSPKSSTDLAEEEQSEEE